MKPASFEHAEWIDPWRDRRPMTDDRVLVTFFANGKMYVDTGCYVKGDVEWVRNVLSGEGWRAPGTVLAWMPLPEAYNPVEEE